MPHVLLVRHGETAANAAQRYQGQNGTALNGRGELQAARLSQRLARETIARLWCSDLPRALQTAAPTSVVLGVAITPDPRLREIDVGEWEGLTFAEIEQRYPDVALAWVADPGNTRIPGGESAADMAARVSAVLADLRALPDDEAILLVTHGGWIETFLCLALGVELRRRYQFRTPNAALTQLALYGEHTLLTSFGDVYHLAGLED
jgi:broad specificity phosphatase PhoE